MSFSLFNAHACNDFGFPYLHERINKRCINQVNENTETQVKAVRKRCVLRLDLKDVRDGDNRVCIGTEFHTQGA